MFYKMVAKFKTEGLEQEFEQFFNDRELCSLHIMVIMEQFREKSGQELAGLPTTTADDRLVVTFQDGSTIEGVEITKNEYDANRMVVTMTRPDGATKTWDDIYGEYEAVKTVFDTIALIHGPKGMIEFGHMMEPMAKRTKFSIQIDDCHYDVHPYNDTSTTTH